MLDADGYYIGISLYFLDFERDKLLLKADVNGASAAMKVAV